MRIDNSQAKTFRRCPLEWQERYHFGIEKDWSKATKQESTTGFGTLMHGLLEAHYKNQVSLLPVKQDFPHNSEAELSEAAVMYAAYCARYPVEPFEVVDVERTFSVPLGLKEADHTYTGKFDLIVRDTATGQLQLVDHKTEKRNSTSNLPDIWAVRDQVSLYLWAAQQLYGEAFHSTIINVLTRQSEKGRCEPEFRRESLQRNPQQLETAVRDIIYIADQIEAAKREFGDTPFPANREMCQQGRWKCQYYDLHLLGRSQEQLIFFKKAEDYLDL